MQRIETKTASKKVSASELQECLLFSAVVFASLLALSSLANAAFNYTAVQGSIQSDFRLFDVDQVPDRVYPGDSVLLKMSVSTVRSEGVSDAAFSVVSPFEETTSTTTMNSLTTSDRKALSRSFTVPKETKPGTYLVYVYASAASIPQQEVAKIPITVYEPSVTKLLLAQLAYNDSLKTGDAALVLINLTNTGALDAHEVFVGLTLNASGPFTPLEYDQKYVGKIKAGETAQVPFSVGVDADTSPGFYPLTANIIYSVDNAVQPTVQQNLGIKVEANQQLLITSDFGASSATSSGGGTLLTITVANVGDTAVRGVYLKASSNAFRISGASDKFIGTLNLDDSSTMSLTLAPRASGGVGGAAFGARTNATATEDAAEQTVTVLVSYKDPLNQERSVKQVIPIQLDAAASGYTSTGTQTASSQRFVRQQQNQGLFGISWTYLGAVAALIAIGVGYWWFKKRKNKRQNMQQQNKQPRAGEVKHEKK